MTKQIISPIKQLDKLTANYTNFSSTKREKKKYGLDKAIEKLKELNFYQANETPECPAPQYQQFECQLILGKIFRDLREKSDDVSTLYSERKDDFAKELKLIEFTDKERMTSNFADARRVTGDGSKNTFKVVVPSSKTDHYQPNRQ